MLVGHPPGVAVLFFAEMWERYSYYGMRSLLIFYLVDRFALSPGDAAVTYGAYTSMVYGAAILGGYLADRLIGLWRSVQWGGVLILMGHVILAWEGSLEAGQQAGDFLFFVALALVVTGTGVFKPSSTALVSALYPEAGARRETGYYIFYLGINLGSALAAITVGYVGQRFGWHFGFGLAALGMMLGLTVTYRLGHHVSIHAPPLPTRLSHASAMGRILGALLSTFLIVFTLLRAPQWVGLALVAAVTVGALALWRQCGASQDAGARRKLAAAAVILVVATLFWSLFEQAGSSFALFTAQSVDLDVAEGWGLTAAQTQFFNPMFILLCTPLFAMLWAYLSRVGREPGVAVKLALAMVQAGIGFLCLVVGILQASAGEGLVALSWLVLAYFFHTCGELCLSPLAMSGLTRLVPTASASLVMGMWLFTLAAGNFVGGQLAARIVGSGGGDGSTPLDDFSRIFFVVAMSSIGIAAVLILLRRRIGALTG